jgi:hypothetical protein
VIIVVPVPAAPSIGWKRRTGQPAHHGKNRTAPPYGERTPSPAERETMRRGVRRALAENYRERQRKLDEARAVIHDGR